MIPESAPQPEPSGPLARLIEALRGAGADPDPETVADALWLLLQIDPREGELLHVTAPDSHATSEEATQGSTSRQGQARNDERSTGDGGEVAPGLEDGGADLLPGVASPEPGRAGALLKTALAPALPDAPEITRALRPFRRRVPSRTHQVIDEQATARRSADENALRVVLRPVRTRWLAVDLVIDESASMMIWRRTALAFRRLLARLGAFRDVRVWGLNADTPGPPGLYTGVRSGPRGGSARSLNELIDPSSRRLVLILSDCVSPGWHSGAVARAIGGWAGANDEEQSLAGWGRAGPVAIVQVLPPALWRRTALARATRVRTQAASAGVTNSRLVVTVDDPQLDEEDRLPPGLAVPVFALEPQLAARWAHMVANGGNHMATSYILDPTGRALPPSNPVRGLSARRLVQNFIDNASHEARDLALLLATMPVTLPVINLVQAVALPGSRQVHAAEVLLSGMLRQTTPPELVDDPDEIAYEFVEGVRELLLEAAPLVHPVELLEQVAAYIVELRGQGDTMQARVPGVGGPAVAGGAGRLPFARVSPALLQSLGLITEATRAAEDAARQTAFTEQAVKQGAVPPTEQPKQSSAPQIMMRRLDVSYPAEMVVGQVALLSAQVRLTDSPPLVGDEQTTDGKMALTSTSIRLPFAQSSDGAVQPVSIQLLTRAPTLIVAPKQIVVSVPPSLDAPRGTFQLMAPDQAGKADVVIEALAETGELLGRAMVTVEVGERVREERVARDSRSTGTTRVELYLSGRASVYTVGLRIEFSDRIADLGAEIPVALDLSQLRALSLDVQAYGQALTAMLFADGKLREGFAQARSFAIGSKSLLRLLIYLRGDASELASLRWELLGDPESGRPLALDEQIILSRYTASASLRATPPSRGGLRTLIAVSTPNDLGRYNLSPIDSQYEVMRFRRALQKGRQIVVEQPVTLRKIVEGLRDGLEIIVLVCHSTLVDGAVYVWLESEDGRSTQVRGEDLVDMIARLARQPLLMVLVTDQTTHQGSAALVLGPQLLRAGVPAVLAFEEPMPASSFDRFISVFFRELERHGAVDQAVAVARRSLSFDETWWAPVLWTHVRDGQLWAPR